MGITSTRELDGEGRLVLHSSTEAISMKGQDAVLAVDETVNLAIKGSTGRLAISDGGSSSNYNFHVLIGTNVVVKGSGAAVFTAVKDTADSINVYEESGEVVVQNKTGAEVSLNIKAYI